MRSLGGFMKLIIHCLLLCLGLNAYAADTLQPKHFSFDFDPTIHGFDIETAITLQAQKRFASVFFTRDTTMKNTQYTEKDILLRPIYVRVKDYTLKEMGGRYQVNADILISKSVLDVVEQEYADKLNAKIKLKEKKEALLNTQCQDIDAAIASFMEMAAELGKDTSRSILYLLKCEEEEFDLFL